MPKTTPRFRKPRSWLRACPARTFARRPPQLLTSCGGRYWVKDETGRFVEAGGD
jgi:hypothetical protein